MRRKPFDYLRPPRKAKKPEPIRYKRYLVTYIIDGVFCLAAVEAYGITDAMERLVRFGIKHDEIYAVTRAA